MPCCCIAGSRSRSISRTSRLYSSWQVTKAAKPVRARCVRARVDLLRRKVRAADRAHLALADQLVERAQRLFDRRVRIGEMHLVEVDLVGAQPLQAGLDGLHDRSARERAGSALLSQPNLVARTTSLRRGAERLAEELFRRAVAVDVGGVEQRDAEIERAMHHGARNGDVMDAAAEVVAADADDGDFDAGLPSFRFSMLGSLRPLQSQNLPRLVRGRDLTASRCAMPTMRSTSTALFLANSPGAI